MADLEVALTEISTGTAAGEDNIHGEVLKQLSKMAKRNLLRLFNRSLSTGVAPRPLWHGIIVPILKPKKPESG